MLILMSIMAVSATAAMAAPPPGKGKPLPTGPGCKPNVTVILRGTLTSDPAAGATSLTMNVTGTSSHGKALKGLGVTIMLDAKTAIRRQGQKTVESLALNDRANVQLRRCKGDLPLTTTTVDDVAAKRVTAQAAKA
jgi:hypothetical protein